MDLSKHEIKITDMKAFKVGNAQNIEAATGCTSSSAPRAPPPASAWWAAPPLPGRPSF